MTGNHGGGYITIRPDDDYHTSSVSLAMIDSFIAIVEFYDGADQHNKKLRVESPAKTSRPGLSTFSSQPTVSSSQPWDNPVNDRLIAGSDYSYEKRSQEQWNQLRRFIEKTDGFYESIKARAATCGFLQQWLTGHESPSKMRREGLLVLRDIFCKETPSCAFGLFSAMVVQDFIRDITCITNDTHSALSMWKDNLSLLVEAQDLDRLYDLLSFRNNVASQPGVRDPEYQEQYTSLGEIGGQFNGATSSPISFLSYAIQDDVPMHDSPSPSPTVSPELWMNPAASLPNIHLGPGNYSSGTQCNFINELDNMNGSTSFLSPEFGQLFPPPPQQYRPNDQPPFASPTPEPQHPIHPLNPSSVTALTASGNGLNRTAPFQLFLKFLNDFGKIDCLLELFSADCGSQHPRDPPPPGPVHLVGSTTINRHAEFAGEIHRLVLSPLSTKGRPSTESDGIIDGIMAATARMLCLGNLDCLRRIELYITSLSKRLITDRNYFKKFVQDVLDTCRNAADGKPHHFCYSRRSPRNSGVSEPALAEYSKQYIHDQWHELSRRQDSSHAPSELLASSRMATRSKSSSLPFPSSQRSTTAASDTLSSIHDDITSQTSFAPSDTKSCPRCEKVYSGKSAATSLSRHLRKHQSNPDRYSCPYCTKKDSRSCNLSKHIEKVHPTMFVPKFGKRGKQRQPAVSQPPS